MDLSCMPHLSLLESQILASSDNKEMFIEKFEEMQHTTSPIQRSPSSLSHFHPNDGGLMIGGMNGDNGKPKIIDYMSGKKKVRDTHEYESRVVYNGIPIPVKIPVAILPETVGDVSYFHCLTLQEIFINRHSFHSYNSSQHFPHHILKTLSRLPYILT